MVFQVLPWLVLLGLAAQAAANQPRIACDGPVHDFGTVGDTNDVAHVFVLKNTGDVPLVIEHVRACCGSTAALATSRIPPGAETRVHTKTSTRGRSGPLKKAFYVKSNDPQEPYYQLRVEGVVSNRAPWNARLVQVHLAPAEVDFGQIRDDVVAPWRVSMLVPTNQPFRVTNLLCAPIRTQLGSRPQARVS